MIVSSLVRAAAVLVTHAVLAASSVAAQPLSVVIPEVSKAPSIEAYLTPEPPLTAGRIEAFRQREPRDGAAVSHGTTAFLSYDRQQLYVIFVCQDEPNDIRARITRREQSESDADDSVSIYLDTFHDQRRAYVFTANPLGVQADGIMTEGQAPDASFDTLWFTESRLTSFGYVVKMTIPFRSLRFTSDRDQTWGVALSRRIRRLDEDAFWPLISKRAQAFVPQFADASGLNHVNPGTNVQFTPYGVTTNGVSDGDAIDERRLGFDTKFGIGSAFVVDATVNPDFSEVESDTPQVTVNERFEVLFPERRPFFVENAGYFNTPIPLFFSRRVVDPTFGVRMTGKSGPWATGALVTPDAGATAGAGGVAVVGSLRRDLARDSHVGALATVRDADSGRHVTLSIDGRWTLGRTWAAVGQLIRTQASGSRLSPAATGTGGTGVLAELAHSSRHVGLLGRYTDLTPAFAAPLGFIRRVDIRQLDHSTSYRFRPTGGAVVKYGPTLDGFVIWDHQGVKQDWRLRPRFEIDLVRQTQLRVERSYAYERYLGLDFDKSRTSFQFESEFSRQMTVETSWEWGTDINRRPPSGQSPTPARSRTVDVSATLRSGRHVAYTQTYLQTRLDALAVPATTSATPILTDHIVRSKLNVFVTRALSFRGIVDFERLAVDPSRTRVRPTRPLGIDLLATLQLNPGTAIFIGYLNRFEPTRLGNQPIWLSPVESAGHQFFVKASWLFRY